MEPAIKAQFSPEVIAEARARFGIVEDACRALDAWSESYLDRRAFKIENDIPFIDLDFATF